MSTLKELLNKHCPNGTEYKTLEDVCSIYTGKQLNRKNMIKEGYPVINGGVSASGYTDKYNEEENTITIAQGGNAGFVNFINTKFWAGAHCYVIKPIIENINNKFLFYVLKNIEKYIMSLKTGTTILGLQKIKVLTLKIPIPPIEVQKEIVRILDTFTKYQDLLNRELELRKKQYEYYRDKLLTFAEGTQPCGDKVEWKNIDEIVNILDNLRKPVSKDKRTKGNYPYYGANGIQDYVDNYIFDGTFILMGEDGSVINKDNSPVLNWASGKIWVNNHAHVLFNENIDILRFVFYYLQTVDVSSIVRGTPPKINQQNLRSIKIPVPPLEEQERIVNILDKFDALCNDITKGLPAEIEMRKKQYEYYRDKLLTFKEKNK
ncbi:restriction endonuclease subunit S [Brachyspira pilosicoli]|uniref:Restriction endonuclease subunit S n=1 Tax=Brachyspira pilosicoli TaxID=52584 RepID=A0A5C8ETN1_BRAPL|nr:restriction endonuclease subunit S [Brachyspira pilosicoli]TXJ40748.1 restriction endonuclease subunit S [Brachyspira pilosicoli]